MDELSTGAAARPLEALSREGTLGTLSDAQLLERFLASGATAGAAFDVLMARHGPMVPGICRRILRDRHAADDSFQATFLVLVQRTAAIRRRESLGPWLHGVARRAALRARAAATVRPEREARAAIDPVTTVAELEPIADDLGPALHDEIVRLPDSTRPCGSPAGSTRKHLSLGSSTRFVPCAISASLRRRPGTTMPPA